MKKLYETFVNVMVSMVMHEGMTVATLQKKIKQPANALTIFKPKFEIFLIF